MLPLWGILIIAAVCLGAVVSSGMLLWTLYRRCTSAADQEEGELADAIAEAGPLMALRRAIMLHQVGERGPRAPDTVDAEIPDTVSKADTATTTTATATSHGHAAAPRAGEPFCCVGDDANEWMESADHNFGLPTLVDLTDDGTSDDNNSSSSACSRNGGIGRCGRRLCRGAGDGDSAAFSEGQSRSVSGRAKLTLSEQQGGCSLQRWTEYSAAPSLSGRAIYFGGMSTAKRLRDALATFSIRSSHRDAPLTFPSQPPSANAAVTVRPSCLTSTTTTTITTTTTAASMATVAPNLPIPAPPPLVRVRPLDPVDTTADTSLRSVEILLYSYPTASEVRTSHSSLVTGAGRRSGAPSLPKPPPSSTPSTSLSSVAWRPLSQFSDQRRLCDRSSGWRRADALSMWTTPTETEDMHDTTRTSAGASPSPDSDFALGV